MKDVLGLVTKDGSLEDISYIMGRASIYDAVALADKGASVAEIVRFVGKGQDLFTVGQVLEKGVRSADLLILVNKGARAGEVLQLLGKGAEIKDIGTLVDKGVSLSRVIGWMNNGITIENLKYVMTRGTIEKTINIFKRESQVIWLEEGMTEAEANVIGKNPSGWKHIYEKHIIDYTSPENQFAGAFGDSYRDADSIQNLIYKCVEEGSPSAIPAEKGGGTAYVYFVSENNPMTVITGSNGYIVTARPGLL